MIRVKVALECTFLRLTKARNTKHLRLVLKKIKDRILSGNMTPQSDRNISVDN